MSNLEIMDRATSFTTGSYMKEYYHNVQNSKMSYNDLATAALNYSAGALQNIMDQDKRQEWLRAYTRQGNLRYDLSAIDIDGIKNELLKNVVNVAVYHREKDTRASNQIGDQFRPDMSDDQRTVVLFNNIVNHGVEKGYDLLNDPEILNSACRTFVYYRREGKKEVLDNIAENNNVAVYVNNELDTYYTRYGKRDSLNHDSYGTK